MRVVALLLSWEPVCSILYQCHLELMAGSSFRRGRNAFAHWCTPAPPAPPPSDRCSSASGAPSLVDCGDVESKSAVSQALLVLIPAVNTDANRPCSLVVGYNLNRQVERIIGIHGSR